MPYISMPAPKNIRTMVNILPYGVKGFTSIKPTEEIVMTVIYNASRNFQPSISIYPETPHAKTNNSSKKAMSSLLGIIVRIITKKEGLIEKFRGAPLKSLVWAYWIE